MPKFFFPLLQTGFHLVLFAAGQPALRAQSEEAVLHQLESSSPATAELAAEAAGEIFSETNAFSEASAPALDLNTATAAQLEATLELSPAQLDNLLHYRATLGPLLSIYELQAVPGWDPALIRRLLARGASLTTDLDTRRLPWWQGWYRGRTALLARWAPPPPDLPAGSESRFGGLGLRIRHRFDNRLRWGLTAENDAGEALLRGSNRQGFDFYSGHVYLEPRRGRLRSLALGDYTARLGQGLLLQSGFAPGKSAEVTSVARGGGTTLGPYSGFGEAYFLRGAALQLATRRHWQATLLYGNRRRDANLEALNAEAFTALQTSGLHRTAAERADELSLHERLFGASLSYGRAAWRISAQALHLTFDKNWQPAPAPYRRFLFRGRRLTALSIDYRWQYRNVFVFGELGRSENGGLAAVNGLVLTPDRRLTLVGLHRALSPRYQTVYGTAVGESSGAANEQGLYLGADLKLPHRLSLSAFADAWRHPWLRFGARAPGASGHDRLARLTWTPLKTFSTYLLWQQQINNTPAEVVETSVAARRRWRWHAVYRMYRDAVELRSRAEWMRYRSGPAPAQKGFGAFLEIVVRPRGAALSASARYTVFETESYETRIYAYERDLFGSLSIPAAAGSGVRSYLNLSWRLNRRLRLEGRYEETLLQRAVTETSVPGKVRGVKLQVRATL